MSFGFRFCFSTKSTAVVLRQKKAAIKVEPVVTANAQLYQCVISIDTLASLILLRQLFRRR